MRNLLGFLGRILKKIIVLLAVFLPVVWISVARPILPLSNGENYTPPPAEMVARLETHVRYLAEDTRPRNFSHPENLDKAATYIRGEWETMGFNVEEQAYDVEGTVFKNLIVNIRGTNPEMPKIIIGSHYDSAAGGPGADDNASGVAGLIELARHLTETAPAQNIVLVAYTLEEPPIYRTEKMGSFVHAKSEYDKGANIDLMITLEMIGYYSDVPNSQDFPLHILNLFYPNKGNFLGVVDKLSSNRARGVKKALAKNMQMSVHSINGPASLPGIDFSDHRSYWHFGYDAVLITDTAFYRNKAYHTDADTPKRLNYEKMAEVVQGLGGALVTGF